MAAPVDVLRLIDQFHSQLASYRSSEYNEAQVRNEFIEPFFASLGWDIYNKRGNAYAYKDVIYEDSIKIAGSTKAPDYAFRIGGTRKFFVEAKKPSISIKDEITPAYQLRRYAWSAHLPLSILTDFEEFAVYDCRPKPDKSDKSSTGRIMFLNFVDYPSHWDEIYSVFSPQAIFKGSFDQFAEAATGKRGTAEVDDAFLVEIERWRELLVHNIALRNPSLSQRDLNYAVQMTIDRLIFLRICEDRGIEFYGQLQSLLNGGETYARLCQVFRKADERYNSGLFHFHAEHAQTDAPDTLTPTLVLDDKPLKEILGNLYYPDSPYEFSVLPADILGQVYERFLGKVIRLTSGHRAVVEDKPEVKKAGGVFYTPTFIVDYIVKNTLGKLLEGSSPGQVGVGRGTPVRVLDMACGSGSFLIGAYQYLLDWYLGGYSLEPDKWSKGATPRLYQITSREGVLWKLTTSERKRILLDHIYGVDIDSQAVEVTKLSLLLKVLEGESEESIGKQLSMFRERALPDLACNIKCGNSLIGPDFYTSLPSKQGALPGFDLEEQYRINAFDWHKEFSPVFDRPQRSLWLVTFVTHNSRISERMVTYGVKSGDPLILDASDRLLIAQMISDCCRAHHIPVVAWDVLPDHVHMILAAEDEQELDEQVRKIKGFSSYSFQRARGLDKGGHVWAQKFHHLQITDQRMLKNAYSYVMHNHIKHADQWGQDLIDSFETPLPTVDLPTMDLPTMDLPTMDLPTMDLPTMDLPTMDLPTMDYPTRGLNPLLRSAPSPLMGTAPSPLLHSSLEGPTLDTPSVPTPETAPSPAASLSLRNVRDALCITPEQACQPSQGGFDVIIGNPPYIRIQALKQWSPLEVEFYKRRYISASKGNYDIYLVFVEKGLNLLKSDGLLGFILPNKFFNAKYGQPLRNIISEGKNLSKVVYFGSQQVFENATTYTCLMFLSKLVIDNFEFEKVDDLDSWRIGVSGIKGNLQINRVKSAEWNFNVGEGESLFEKFIEMPTTLGDIAHRIFQGFKTGADSVFILDECENELVFSNALNIYLSIEPIYLRPLYKSGEMKRYNLRKNSRYVIFPYRNGSLIEWNELNDNAPNTASYLLKCRDILSKREKGRWEGKHWYCYSRNQALEIVSSPKILTADLNPYANYCFDQTGAACFPGGAAGGYGITLDDNMYLYVLGLLNSKAVDYFHKQISSNFRGGWYGYDAKIIRNIPIHPINFSDPSDVKYYDEMVALVERMLSLHQQLASSNTPTEKTLFQRQIDITDHQIDALVYELYGLTNEDIVIFERK